MGAELMGEVREGVVGHGGEEVEVTYQRESQRWRRQVLRLGA